MVKELFNCQIVNEGNYGVDTNVLKLQSDPSNEANNAKIQKFSTMCASFNFLKLKLLYFNY